MKLKPIGDRVIVRRHVSEDKSTGGIILPDAAKKKPQKGTVLAVGPGKLQEDGSRRKPKSKKGKRCYSQLGPAMSSRNTADKMWFS